MNDDLVVEISSYAEGGTVRIPLRPLLAALAMNGMISNPSLEVKDGGSTLPGVDAIAEAAYLLADAMLKRGDEKPDEGEVADAEDKR